MQILFQKRNYLDFTQYKIPKHEKFFLKKKMKSLVVVG